MPIDSAREALSIVRDGSHLQWHVIPLFGYLHFFLISFWVHDMKTMRAKLTTVGIIWGVDAAALAIFGLALGWI